ncbi:hypothetical protein ACMXYW_14945 [Neptuniibacter sp. QD48_55]|uniref:hypothetical protein n=1 Tax=Neptuniibacter sp. QD48_55 TaxID=3398212 RepID=UPI0039F54FBC
MTPGFSIPTDNIYKFYALLGLALVLSSMLSFVYVYDASRAKTLEWSEEIMILEQKEELSVSGEERKELLEALVKVEEENKNFYMYVLNLALGAGIGIALIGLIIWQFSVQPRSDRLIELQIKSLEMEIEGKDKKSDKRIPKYH